MKLYRDLTPIPSSNLTRDQWDMIVNSLVFFIREQNQRLSKDNASEREWQELSDYEAVLNDIRFYVLPPDDK